MNSPNLILNIAPVKGAFSGYAPESKPTPITSLPANITKAGNYYFTANMYFAVTPVQNEPGQQLSTPAITVNAPGPVAIMRGFTLSGPGQQFINGFYTNPMAIQINSSNVTIKNGSIEGYLEGIDAGNYNAATNTSTPISGIDLENITFINGAEFGCIGFDNVNNSLVRNYDFSQQIVDELRGNFRRSRNQ